MKRDFLSLWDLAPGEVRALVRRARELEAARRTRTPTPTCAGRTLGLVFEKPSTRTRVSFDVAMYELGGHAVYLAPEGTQIGRGEPLRDTARVLGGYCHGIVFRTFAQARLEELAKFSPVPVINGLTDALHPCQLLADLTTVEQRLGEGALAPSASGGARFAWIGDGNNMANSWIEAAALLDLDLVLACPAGYPPDAGVLARALATGSGRITLTDDVRAAVRGADVLSTDVWVSMGDEAETAARRRAFAQFRIDGALVDEAAPRALVLHCLPAHRGEEITDDVLEGPHSAVWAQAENRLHASKALLEMLVA